VSRTISDKGFSAGLRAVRFALIVAGSVLSDQIGHGSTSAAEKVSGTIFVFRIKIRRGIAKKKYFSLMET
jgi:hypothetical protein